MYFERKAYQELLNWKEHYADRYAVLLEGARRVGKSTIAEQFAKKEYDSYLLIDFAKVGENVRKCFDDLTDLDLFFLRLQTETNSNLTRGRSVIIFDEVQRFPRAREAIKYLVQDGRYHYIETGSLISIKKNVKDILIPSEEMKIEIYPMDFFEFHKALGDNAEQLIRQWYELKRPVGAETNRKLMRDFRLYMAVGGMPQAVEAYVNGANFEEIDRVKREIIRTYEDDFKKIDPSGRISMLYRSIPAQLARDSRRYILSKALNRKKSDADEALLYDLLDSKTVLISYNTMEPALSLSGEKDLSSYKLYTADTGLFTSLLFPDRPAAENELYAKMLSDRLPANLGYLYENMAAQLIQASGRELYYHTWEKPGSTHYYEVDFLLPSGDKVLPLEIKSSSAGKHESILKFAETYHAVSGPMYLFSQKDVNREKNLYFKPLYMLPAFLEDI
ncbi:MAG: AAA family ATPase [Lachnospiraceae bacterium]|nr:AAA family ATPase [Lachnospiraceae bacterium]